MYGNPPVPGSGAQPFAQSPAADTPRPFDLRPPAPAGDSSPWQAVEGREPAPIPVYPGPPPNLPAPQPAVEPQPLSAPQTPAQPQEPSQHQAPPQHQAPSQNQAPSQHQAPWDDTDGELPALPAFPGAQPWEVPGEDAAPYDWFAHQDLAPGGAPPPAGPSETSTTTPANPSETSTATPAGLADTNIATSASPAEADAPAFAPPVDADVLARHDVLGPDEPPSWPVAPVVPGAPPWEPPPAFTAAAAGMNVWPAPVSDAPAMPPWPAATGEPIPGHDYDTPHPGGPGSQPADPAGQPPHAPAVITSSADQPGATTPAEPQGPPPGTATPAETQEHNHGTEPQGFAPVATPPTEPQGPAPSATTPWAAPQTPAPSTTTPSTEPQAPASSAPWGEPQAPAPNATTPSTEPQGPNPSTTIPAEPQNPTSSAEPQDRIPDAAVPPDGLAPGAAAPADGKAFDAAKTIPGARPAEPGDVPVWPPKAPADELEDTGPQRLPALPFSSDTWGQKPTLPAPRDPVPSPESTSDMPTPPHGIPIRPAPPAVPGQPTPPEGIGQIAPTDDSPTHLGLPVPVVDSFAPPPQRASSAPTHPGRGLAGQPGAPTYPGTFGTPPAFPDQPPAGPPAPPAKGKAKGKKVLLATLGVLVLVGVGTGGFFAYRSINSSQPAGAAATKPAAPSPTPTSSPALTTAPPDEAAGASKLNSEETDPRALALTEAFPAKKVKISGKSFNRVKVNMSSNCEKAASGPFADALDKQKCSRVLRATYVDSKRRYAVTTGIAVLPTKDAAVEADQAKNLGRNLWFRALPGAAGSGGERVHIAGGYAAGLVWGRYIVFSYATYADGHTPTAKETGLSKLSGDFRDQTAEVLERRVAAK